MGEQPTMGHIALALIHRTLEAEAPAQIPRIYLEGDICRENLLTGIDGIVSMKRKIL